MHSKSLVDELPLAIASMCLGRAAHHELEPKLKAAADAGFQGVEVFYEDLKIPAQKWMTESKATFEESLIRSANIFKDLCDKFGLIIICLQPFKNYDGLLSKERHQEKISKLHVWFKIAKTLQVDIIQIPSYFWSQGATGDFKVIASDLRELADLGAKETPPIRFAYEPMAWGAHVDLWQQGWEIVKLVDRPNFGMCLDTFQILAKVWGDVTSKTGQVENADQILENDIKEFLRTVSLDKIYYVQLSDAERLETPLSPSHPWYTANLKPNMTWSRNARIFPLEEDLKGYLPVLRLFKAWIFDWGYRGWVSMEIFNRSMSDPDPAVPQSHAQRGAESWRKIIKELKLDEISVL
jgi:4-hydroxyphenylpyruvate dioxygenase